MWVIFWELGLLCDCCSLLKIHHQKKEAKEKTTSFNLNRSLYKVLPFPQFCLQYWRKSLRNINRYFVFNGTKKLMKYSQVGWTCQEVHWQLENWNVFTLHKPNHFKIYNTVIQEEKFSLRNSCNRSLFFRQMLNIRNGIKITLSVYPQ